MANPYAALLRAYEQARRGLFGRAKQASPGPAKSHTLPPPRKPKAAPFKPIEGCDYVAGPSPAVLKAAGMKFVCRYLSTPGNPKNLTKAEAAGLHKARIGIVVVFETTGTTAEGGTAAGKADAASAAEQAATLGVPASVPIYLAVDYDAYTTVQLSKVVAYIGGAASVLGASRTGVYGGYKTVKACYDAKACRYFWQALAWSGGIWHPARHIEQYQNAAQVGGHSVDLDRAVRARFGAWSPKV
jgi:hypothetical protein